jgi:NADP-dependent 3-hydroxy acid dehydrogenase YdfG
VGSGFGKATAELFATVDQVNLVLIDFNENALEATADVCRKAGSRVVALASDVTKAETFERALKEALDAFGKVDFLINYAGGALKVAPIEEMDDEINRRIIDLNLISLSYEIKFRIKQGKHLASYNYQDSNWMAFPL